MFYRKLLNYIFTGKDMNKLCTKCPVLYQMSRYVPNVPDDRARPKKNSRQFLVACFCKKMAAPRVFVEVSDVELVKLSKGKILVFCYLL